MKRLFLFAVPVLAAFGVSTQDEKPASPRDPASMRELQRIQGWWQLTSSEENGAKMPDAELKARTIFFGGDAFVVRQGDLFVQAGTHKLDPSKKPKSINAMVGQGERKGDILLGIYELDVDKFKVCFDTEGQKRPDDFKSEPGSGLILAEYKRLRSGEDPKPDVSGEYTSVVAGPDGVEMITDVEIERRGDAYAVSWRKNNATVSTGVAIRRGDTISVSWATQGQSGIAVYQIEKDRKLAGQYTPLGSIGLLTEEKLTPKKRID